MKSESLPGRFWLVFICENSDLGRYNPDTFAQVVEGMIKDSGADVVLATTGHGSAMDIAGTGTARPDALLRSLRLLAGIQE